MQLKYKTISDALYGLIDIESELVKYIIDTPYFQRLRNIKQLALTHLVYPGAEHTRFQHALGCYHLAKNAVKVLRTKGIDISTDEEKGLLIAALLHDVGHGPFSHTLEHSLVNCHHEQFSIKLMQKLNEQHNGYLNTALQIYKGEYPKKFLHQLISSQIDVDRLDYLKRDSFYTGVAEGAVGSERIIKMYEVQNNELLINNKGVFSIEKFLLARRMMYWQVYLHKTVLSAEVMLQKIIGRVRFLVHRGETLFITEPLRYFLLNDISTITDETLQMFTQIDDSDIMCCVREWSNSQDPILATLSSRLLHRELNKIIIQTEDFSEDFIASVHEKTIKKLNIKEEDVFYFVYHQKIGTHSYHSEDTPILFKERNGVLKNISEVSTILNNKEFNFTDVRYFLSYPRCIIE